MKQLRYEMIIGGSPETVWNALVSPEHVSRIYYGSVIRSDFEPGGSIEYVGPGADGDETVHVYGTILEHIPQRTLRFTHYAGPSYLKGAPAYESRITWQLAPAGSCTKLTLIHDSWHPEDPSYAASGEAWVYIMSSTKTLVETGHTLDTGM